MSTRTIPADARARIASGSRRINPDSIHTLWITVGIVGILAVVSFMVSFAGLSEVARWVGVPEWMAWSVPTFIDLAIVAYTLAVLIHRSRGERTVASWCSLGVFTAVSVVANAAHALSVGHAVEWQAWIGAGIAAMAPLAVLAATEELGRLAVAPVTQALEDAPTPVEAPVQMQEAPVPAAPAPELAAPVTVREVEAQPAPEAPVAVEDDVPLERVPVYAVEQPLITVSLPLEAESGETPATLAWAQESTQAELKRDEPVFDALQSTTDDEESQIAEWVEAEVEAGREPSGSALARHLNVSDRTGRRKLKAFNDAQGDAA